MKIAKENILVLNRFHDEFALYSQYIDLNRYNVHYITTQDSYHFIKEQAQENVKIVIYNQDHWLEEFNDICNNVKSLLPIKSLICTSEYDMVFAGKLREKFKISGRGSQATALVRDKMIMKKRIKDFNIKTSFFLENFSNIPELNGKNKWILKPTTGAFSSDINIFSKTQDLKEFIIQKNLDEKNFIIEEFISGKIFHIDGIFSDKIEYITFSKYFNNCYQHVHEGKALGSLLLPESELTKKLHEFTQKILEALEFKDEAFHLEVIKSDYNNELYFLEIGARVGGGEIPFLHKKYFGVDLYKHQIELQLNQDFTLENFRKNFKKSVGFIMPPKEKNISLNKKLEGLDSFLFSGEYLDLEKTIKDAVEIL